MRLFLSLIASTAIVFVCSCNKHAVIPEHIPSAADSIDFIDTSVFSCKIDGWMFVPQASKPKLFGPDIRPLSVFLLDTFFSINANYYIRTPEAWQNIGIQIKYPKVGRFRLGDNFPYYFSSYGDHGNGIADSVRASYLYIDSYNPTNKKCSGRFECVIFDKYTKQDFFISEGKFNFDFSQK